MAAVKVCHMSSVHPPEDVRVFHKECVSLARAGYEVYLVVRGESCEKNGVHVVGVGELPRSRVKRMVEGTRRVYERALSLDCDIYHLHDPELLPYGLKLRKKGKKVVFDSHELTKEQIKNKSYLPSFVRRTVSLLYAAYESAVLKKLDAVIFPCPINGRFPLPGRRKVFLNNVPSLSELYDRYDPNAEKERDTVCTAGSLSPARGIRQMILAAHRAGCKAVLAGTFRPAAFEAEIRQMPESADAVLLGQLDREQVVQVYQRSVVGVSSICNVGQYDMCENMPTKVYEFMAMGLPVVLTRNPFNEKMTKQYGFGVCVDPDDTEEFARALRELLDDPQKAREMGQNGRKAVRDVFNWELEQEKLLALYEELVKQR